MTSLSDKLKALGVRIGTNNLPKSPPRIPHKIEQVLDGNYTNTPYGSTFVVNTIYPDTLKHGKYLIKLQSSLKPLIKWAGYNQNRHFNNEHLAFIDIETTGLSGGTGTYAFLIGAGRFFEDTFQLAQFFMQEPTEEISQLHALENFIAPCQILVTYNGKSFDIPLLRTRFTSHGWQNSFADYLNIDLLHLSRRLWKHRLQSRTLGNIEYKILDFLRTQEDVPGWMIPQIYFDYLRSEDARPLKSVFYHNAVDVLSLAALLNHTSNMLNHPQPNQIDPIEDLVSIAKLFNDIGDEVFAERILSQALEHDMAEYAHVEGLELLAMIFKRQDQIKSAVELWKEAAAYQHIEAHIELAKYYEHRLKKYSRARKWTCSAIEIVSSHDHPIISRIRYLSELEHRLERLDRLIGANN